VPQRGGMDSFAGPLTLVWGANARRSSVLHVPVVTHAASPATSHNRRREEWALGEEAKPYWRGVSLVRTQELHGAQVRYRYAAHLVVELPAWFPPDRYEHGDASVRAGFDTGPGKIAVVTVHDDAGITGTRFLGGSSEQIATQKDYAAKRRRAQRALERSRRNSNPTAYERGRARKGHPVGKKGTGVLATRLARYVAVRGQLSPVDGTIELIDIAIDLEGLDPGPGEDDADDG
jgi:hypothetical protein